MENLKIEAENLDQKNEIINLFISLGCKKDSFCTYNNDNLMGIHFYRDGDIQDVLDEDYNHGEHKEITLPELRALVSLHKNPINMDKVLSAVRSDALGLLNDQYAEIEKVRQNSKLDQSISDFKNTDRGKEFDAFDLIEDTVNHPSHYASSSIECIDAMEAMLTPEQFIGYLRGNSFKYMWRYENKGGITDLEKAQWYLNKLISRIG